MRFEQAWMKKLEANAPDMKVFDTSRGVDLIRGEGHWHFGLKKESDYISCRGIQKTGAVLCLLT